MRRRKSASIAIRSEYEPCFAHVFSMKTWLSRSTMRARISPGLVLRRARASRPRPARICSRTSITHCGQSESVSRGKPELREGALLLLQQRRRRPAGLKRLVGNSPVDRLAMACQTSEAADDTAPPQSAATCMVTPFQTVPAPSFSGRGFTTGVTVRGLSKRSSVVSSRGRARVSSDGAEMRRRSCAGLIVWAT